MKLTVVVDNMVSHSMPRPLRAEHGYALLIEIGGKKILLDAGQSDVAVHNLSLLGVHPDELDAIAISHGHYDHASGLIHVLKHRTKPVPVYGHSAIFTERYSVAGGKRRYIGISNSQEELETVGAQFCLSEKPQEIVDGLVFSGTVTKTTEYEEGDKKLVLLRENGEEVQDELVDDTSLYYKHPEGLVVLSGCAHSGFVNTVEHGFKVLGVNKLIGWVGGTHLGPVSKIQQEKTLAQIEAYKPQFIAASHCTGFVMMGELERRLGEVFISGMVGKVIQA